ncbi:MAG TPA: lactonase family protein [Rhodothermales bacterium]|nr:lactonase family protein [Rhodothermales bacterium]
MNTRRDFIKGAGLGALALALPSTRPTFPPTLVPPERYTLFVGTYTQGASKGIYIAQMDAETGRVEVVDAVASADPSFLALDPTQRHLYAVNELMEFEGERQGAASAFTVDPDGAGLRFAGQQPTGGGAPCHVALDGTGRYVVVANYMGGNVAVFPVAPDGGLGARSDLVQFHGSGPNKKRQEAPHAHQVIFDPANRYVFVCDLGTDRVMGYRLDAEQGKLRHVSSASLPPGSGPRHLAFHPNGGQAYVVTEMASTIVRCAYDPASGTLTARESVPMLPADFEGESTAAEIAIHPSGRFLYASNRGHDSIVVYAIDPASGMLSLVQHQSTLGKTPRSFTIAPGSRFLLVANKDSDSVISFALDAETGRLAPTGDSTEIPMPVCLLFAG